MYKLVVMILVVIFSGCTTTSLEQGEKLEANSEGVVMIGVHLQGVMRHMLTGKQRAYLSVAKSIKNKKKAITVLPLIEIDGKYSILMLRLKEGIYHLGGITWNTSPTTMSNIQKLKCLGEFIIKNGKINYIGDLSLKMTKFENNVFWHTQHYSFGLFENKDASLELANEKYKWLLDKYDVVESVATPDTCKTD